MRVFLLVLVFSLLLFAIFKISDEKLNRKNKIALTIFAVLAAVLAYIYESDISRSESRNLELLTAFNQGKILTCKEQKISNEKFNYEFGTASFIAKREFKELSSIKIQISDCEMAE